MPDVLFLEKSLDDMVYWAHNDRKTFDKVNALLNDIARNGASKGIGKPELLKHEKAWARRIDHSNRLIYEMRADNIIAVKSCKGHYDD